MKMPPVLADALVEAARRDAFWAANFPALLAQYPDQLVAMREGEIVAHEVGLTDLIVSLKNIGLEPKGVSIQWVSASMKCLVL